MKNNELEKKTVPMELDDEQVGQATGGANNDYAAFACQSCGYSGDYHNSFGSVMCPVCRGEMTQVKSEQPDVSVICC